VLLSPFLSAPAVAASIALWQPLQASSITWHELQQVFVIYISLQCLAKALENSAVTAHPLRSASQFFFAFSVSFVSQKGNL
jgi:hypothetical protein